MVGRTKAAVMDLTVLILTYNEELNLPYALESVAGWADQIIVVDSFSQDKTVDIAQSFGAEVYQNRFEDFVQQRNWAMEVPTYRHEWFLYIDADEEVSPELKGEIMGMLASVSNQVAGFEMQRQFFFLGKPLKHGISRNWFLRLIRRGRCRFVVGPHATEYAVIQGPSLRLKHDLIHRDRRSLSHWIQNQNRDTSKIALGLFQAGGRIEPPKLGRGETLEGRFRIWTNRILLRMPLPVRCLIRFLALYILRRTFLDGGVGFAYCALHGFWQPLLVGLKQQEFAVLGYALEEAKRAGWR